MTFLHSNNINTIFYYGVVLYDSLVPANEWTRGKKAKVIVCFRKKGFIPYYYYYGFQEGKRGNLKEILDLCFDLFYYLFKFFSRRRLSTFHFSFRVCVIIIKCWMFMHAKYYIMHKWNIENLFFCFSRYHCCCHWFIHSFIQSLLANENKPQLSVNVNKKGLISVLFSRAFEKFFSDFLCIFTRE